MTIRRGTGCAVVEVSVSGNLPDGAAWAPGPLPVRWISGKNNLLAAPTADRTTRLRYFEPRVAAALYDGHDHHGRWHHPGGGSIQGVDVIGTELLVPVEQVAGPRWGLAVLHMEFDDAPLAGLSAFTDISPESDRGLALRSAVETFLPAGVTVRQSASRPFLVSHLTFQAVPLTRTMPATYDAWQPSAQWLWLAASATPVDRFPPDPLDESLFAGRVRFSADWQALVLRDGAAFVGLTPDPGDGGTFHPVARALVHSVYLDVFLLGLMQCRAMNDLANRVAVEAQERLDHAVLAGLEERLAKLRGTLGSGRVTSGGHANELLQAFRRQHQLAELTKQVVQDLTDAARLVEAENGRRVSAALGLITVIGLPFGLAYTAAAASERTGLKWLLAWTGVAALCSLLLVAGIPPVRGLLRTTRRSR